MCLVKILIETEIKLTKITTHLFKQVHTAGEWCFLLFILFCPIVTYEINLGREMNYTHMLVNATFFTSGWTINLIPRVVGEPLERSWCLNNKQIVFKKVESCSLLWKYRYLILKYRYFDTWKYRGGGPTSYPNPVMLTALRRKVQKGARKRSRGIKG